MMKDDNVVGHVPRVTEKTHVVWHFIKHHGIMNCQVTAQRKLLVCFKLSNQLMRQHAINSNNMLLTESGFKQALHMH